VSAEAALYPAIRYAPSRATWVVALEWVVWADGREWVVPAGAAVDGASIPRLLWPLYGHPFDEDYYPAAVLHDHLYRTGQVARERADRVFVVLMARLGVDPLRRQSLYHGVRVFGAPH
jgi:hypothetical protein